jgi:hopanoid biosynthesis associated RND transporter like protein HpnN
MKALSADSFLARLLGKLAVAICRHPRWFVGPQVILFLISLVVTTGFLQFDTDRNNLVGGRQLYHHNFLQFQKEFPQQDDLVVVVESENVEKNRQFVERLGARLETETNLFRDTLFEKDIALVGDKGLQLAKESELVEMKEAFTTFLPFVQKFTTATNLVSFFDLINTQFRTAKRETNAQNDSLVQALPALEGILRQARDSLKHSGAPAPPSIAALFGGGESDVASNYISFADGRLFLLTTHAPNEATNDTPPVLGTLLKNAILENVFHKREASGDLTGDAIARLRQLINETKREIPGVNVGLIGEPVLDSDEMLQSQKDTTLAGVVSLILCAIIFIYGYNETGRPIKAIVCLLVGLAYTLAFATLTVGHLNVLTITFLPMLIGLAIDFGVHLITRYEEELRHGKTAEQALTKAMVFTGQGIFTGALTTAGAFAAMAFTDFKGIREMGIICGGGLMVCLVPMLTLLPVLLLRGKQNVIDHSSKEDEKRARIENLWLSRPVLVTIIIVVTCGLAATQLHKVTFDYNLLNMQSAGLPAVVFEQKLIDSADKSVLFCAVIADNLPAAVQLESKIRALTNVVADVESVAGFLDQDQREKLKLISQIKALVAPLHFLDTDPQPVNVYALSRTLYSFSGYVGLARDAVGTNDPALAQQFAALQTTVLNFRKAMLAGDNLTQAEHAETLGQFQKAFFDDLRETFTTLQKQDDRTPLRLEDLPAVLRDRFVGVHGKLLLQVYPRKNVWQRDNQKEFIDALRAALDPQGSNHPVITGTPVQLLEYESQLKDSYITAAWYSLIAIAIMVFFHFRSLTAVVLSLIPVAIGTLWLIGMMGWRGVPFNPANIMTLPLVIGIGVTNGIHILNRFAEERTPGILARSTGKAVLVSGLTAIAGFGSLILAKHRGIHSLGFIMSVGIATCMLAGLTFLPALLNLISRWRPLIKKPDVSRTTPTPGQEEPR